MRESGEEITHLRWGSATSWGTLYAGATYHEKRSVLCVDWRYGVLSCAA